MQTNLCGDESLILGVGILLVNKEVEHLAGVIEHVSLL